MKNDIEVSVLTVSLALPSINPVIAIRDVSSNKIMLIPTPPFEATSVISDMQGIRERDRDAYDLIKNLIEGLFCKTKKVVIDREGENTYLALIYLKRGEQTIKIVADADNAIATAMRIGCPIFVSAKLFEKNCQELSNDEMLSLVLNSPQPQKEIRPEEKAMEYLKNFKPDPNKKPQ